MTKNTMTKRESFNAIITILENGEYENRDYLIDFLKHEVEVIDATNEKRREKRQASTGTNSVIKNTILAILAEHENAQPVSALMEDERLLSYQDGETSKRMTSQKLSSMLYQLVKEGKVDTKEIKKKAYYSLAE